MYTEMLQKKLTSGIHPQNGTKVDVVSVGGPKLNLPWFGNHLISFWYGIKDDKKIFCGYPTNFMTSKHFEIFPRPPLTSSH